MNTPFEEQIYWLPDFIGEELMNQQEYQGNKRDIIVFEEDVAAGKDEGGFEWKDTSQKYNFWDRVLLEKDINLFLAWFKPELEVWDNENEKCIAQVIGYNENKIYPFYIKKEVGNIMYKHARLPKKIRVKRQHYSKK